MQHRTAHHHIPRTNYDLGAPGIKTLNTLIQSLIESLTQWLQQPGKDAIQTLEVYAPVLI
ncbi:hypothetical protein DENIT_20597 [Pseudomonas veronii]|nr:hypothetical protein DENIT_20597 [Pseudomonas veronii]